MTTRLRATKIRTSILLVFIIAVSGTLFAQTTPRQWDEDLTLLIKKIKATHPAPFRRVSEKQFDAAVAKLHSDLPRLSSEQALVRMMQIVALLRDRHTSVLPTKDSEFKTWFPIRIYSFTDGLFITVIDKKLKEFAGYKVLKVNGIDAEKVLQLALSAFSSDNDFGGLESTTLISSPAILKGLGIASPSGDLLLDLESPAGEKKALALPPVNGSASFDWLNYGEMFGPPGTDTVTSFSGRPERQYVVPNPNSDNLDLPLHLRSRRAYWFTYLEPQKVLYFQLNNMAASSSYTKEPLSDLVKRLFAFTDSHPVDSFIFDLRYNSGGDGSLVNTILHYLIKRDTTVSSEGHFFMLSGRKTYSAGGGMYVSTIKQTSVLTVGEPAGVAANGCGDPDNLQLPNSKLQVLVSTNYSMSSTSKDMSWEIPVQYPAPFSSREYFSGQDPAIDAILSGNAGQTIL